MVSEEKANQEVTSQQQENTPSPGAMLKARRETLGLSQQDIADKLFLKVNISISLFIFCNDKFILPYKFIPYLLYNSGD